MTEQEAIDTLKEHKKLIDKEYLKARNSKAIEVVLNMLKEKNEIIEKLQKENETLKNFVSGIVNENIEKDFIPVQKVKDKIEEIQEDKTNKYYYMFLEDRDLEYTIEILQELLESEE